MEQVQNVLGFDLKAAARKKAEIAPIQTVDVADVIATVGATELALGNSKKSGKTYLHFTGPESVISIKVGEKCGAYSDIMDLVNNNIIYCGNGVGADGVPYYWFTFGPAVGTGERNVISVADFLAAQKKSLKAGA